MRHRTQIYCTDEPTPQVWDRWQRGNSSHQIARLFDRHYASVREVLAASSGIRTAMRLPSPRALTLEERKVISRALVAWHAHRAIAISPQSGKPPSSSP